MNNSNIILPNQEQSEIDGWYESSTASNTTTENPLLPEGSLLEIPLTESEKNLIDEFYKEIADISAENEEDYRENKYKNCTKVALERIECLVDKYLQKGIKLNSRCNGYDYTISDLVFKEIINIVDKVIEITPTTISRIDPATGEDALDELTETDSTEVLLSIASKLVLVGAKIRPDFYGYRRIDEVMYGNDEYIFLEYEKIKNKLQNVACESIVNKNIQTQKDDLIVEMDNRSFYIKYPQNNSTIEVAKVIDNPKIKDLNFRCHIFHIGKSIVKVEKLGEKRNYTDVPEGSIKMSFTTEIEGKTEKISILLHSDKEDNSKIRVELNEENQKKFDKLKNKSSLGKNCLLGGKSVVEAIKDGSFERNRSMSKGSTEQITLIQSNDAIKEPDVPSTSMKETSTSHILHGLGK